MLCNHHNGYPSRSRRARDSIGLTHPAPRAVSSHGTPDLACHREACPMWTVALSPEDGQQRSIDSLALLEERLDLGAVGQPLAARKPAGQTVSRFRPLARRRLSTFRPPLVFIRSRKPWVFFRRRWFGWNVRFIRVLPLSGRGAEVV